MKPTSFYFILISKTKSKPISNFIKFLIKPNSEYSLDVERPHHTSIMSFRSMWHFHDNAILISPVNILHFIQMIKQDQVTNYHQLGKGLTL